VSGSSHRAAPEVLVVGAGPAGSAVAALLARAGRRVLLLDRERFPRFRIGESLMPATYWTLERLGVLERMKASHFPKKCSVQFYSGSGQSSLPFYFSHADPHESSQTWQVDRAEFDSMLLDHARACGAEVRLGVAVRDVRFDGARAVGVTCEDESGARQEIEARVVVDASGQSGLLSRKLRLKDEDPVLRHAAAFTRYRGAVRDAGIDEGATLVLRTAHPRTWFWYIPLPDDQVSVGVVAPIDRLLSGRGGGPRAIYDEEVAACPALGPRIRRAVEVMDVMVLRDFSYISRRIAGDGWALVFLDPIYSTGVFLALCSAELAADSILDGLAAGDVSAARLGRHGPEYVAGMEAMRKLVYAFYTPEFSFARFLARYPDCQRAVVDLLMGNVFRRPVDGLFEALGTMCELPEARTLDPHVA